MERLIFEIFHYIVWGYVTSTFSILFFSIVSSQIKTFSTEYLNVSNSVILCLSTFSSLSTFFSIKNNIESKEAFLINNYRIQNIIYAAILTFTIPLLFLKKSFRQNAIIIIIVSSCLVVFTNYEKAIIIMTSFYRDYLPSGWSIQYSALNFLGIGFATIVYFAAVVLIIKFKKTKA